MTSYALPALYTVAIWWSATGVILFLNRLPARSFPWSLLAATLLLPLALLGLVDSADDRSAGGAYAAFSYAILIWGWLEMTFLMGFITGPRRHSCPAGCSGRSHFGHAVEAILYHELAIIVALVAVATLTSGAVNRIGLWTLLVLWGMRVSAKLNLFYGVPNLGEQFLPAHMQYLKSFFRNRPMNLLFPVSVSVGSLLTTSMVLRAAAPGANEFEVVGFSILAALLGLGVLEHWFMVLPLPSEALWRWSLRSQRERAEPASPSASASIAAILPVATPQRHGDRP